MTSQDGGVENDAHPTSVRCHFPPAALRHEMPGSTISCVRAQRVDGIGEQSVHDRENSSASPSSRVIVAWIP